MTETDDVSRPNPPSHDVQVLIGELAEIEEQLRGLTDGQVDAVLDPNTGVPIMLRHAQEELRRSKARLELLLEHLPAIVWTTDADLRVTALSGTGVAVAPELRGQVVGKVLSEVPDAVARPRLIRAHRQALEGEASHFDVEADGRVFDIWVNPKLDTAGQITGSVGLLVDITERVERESALERLSQELEARVKQRTAALSEAYEELQITEAEIRQQNRELRATRRALEAERKRYRDLFEFAPDGYVVTDDNGIVVEANRAACDLIGVGGDFLVGKPVSVYVSPDDRRTVYQLMGDVQQIGQPGRRVEAEMLLCPRGREPVPVAVVVTAVDAGDGQGEELRWMVRDISETSRLMRENRRQRVFLERLMDLAPIGIAVVRGEDHRFEMANATYRAIPGVKAPVVGRRFDEVLPAVPDEAGVRMLDRVYRTGRAVRLQERKGAFIRGHGQSHWNVHVAPLQGQDGIVDGVLMVVHDVSQEVRARMEMERLARRTQNQADELRAVFEAMTEAVIVYNREGVAVRANQAAVEVCGVDPVGKDSAWIAERLHISEPDGGPIPTSSLPSARALRGERVEGMSYIVEGAEGTRLAMVVSAAPLGADRDDGGAVTVWHDVTERERLLNQIDHQRKLAEGFADDLAQERDTLQTIMETTHAQLAYLDADFRFVRVNTAYAQGSGHRKEWLIGRDHFELFPDPENEEIFQRVRETGEAVFFDAKPFVFVDQQERGVTYWDWSLIPVTDDAGETRGLVLSLLDVTERVRAEAQVRRYADQLRVLHEIDVAILAASSATEIGEAALKGLQELVPSAVSRVALVDPESGESRVLASRGEHGQSGAPEWCSLSWDMAADVLARGMPFVVEDRNDVPEPALEEALRAEGLCSVTCVPLIVGETLLGCLRVGRKETGLLTEAESEIVQAVADQAAIGIYQAELHDQLQRYAGELENRVAVRTAQLRASEARFRAMFEQSVLGIAMLDRRGRIVAANPALCDMLARSQDQLVGELLARFRHPDEEIAAALRTFRKVVNGERNYLRVETRYVAAEERERWVNLVVSPVLSPEGGVRFLIAMAEDVTERKQAEEALVRSEKLATTGRLAAALAHEINNPLQAVLGCLGLAQESLGDGEDRDLDEYLEMGLQELRRAAGIVSRLRDVSRPFDQGQTEPTDVNELIDGILTLTEKPLEQAQIEVVRRTPENLPRPEVVRDRIKQVLLNLVLNAIEAMSQGGTLELVTSYDEKRREVCLSVTDSGPGIPGDVLSHLFSPFFSTKDDGLGLGLFVSQNIVQESGGRMEVDSEIGRGTTFTVRLPV